ncbi:hypothetical protein V8E54_007920 [Elaphomyces granulatus]
MSSVPEVEKRKRLAHILRKFPLDQTQRSAFDKSTSAICAGVHLIQGPPGTGKTRTALVIILALASLNLRVLLTAGSNKGVDKLQPRDRRRQCRPVGLEPAELVWTACTFPNTYTPNVRCASEQRLDKGSESGEQGQRPRSGS